MNFQKNTSAMVETAIISALLAVLAIAGAYIPMLGYALFIIPVPYAFVGIRNSIRYSVMGILITTLLTLMFGLPQIAVFVFIYGGIASIILVYITKEDIRPDVSLLGLTLGILVSISVILTLTSMLMGLDVFEMIKQILNQSKDLLASDTSILEGEMVDDVDDIIDQIMVLIPFLLIMTSAISAGANFMLNRYVLKRSGEEITDYGKFSEYRLPDNIIIGTTIILVLTYLSGKTGWVNFDSLFINVFLIIVYIFMIQGIAVLFHYLDKRNVANIFKGVILFVIFLLQGIILLGIIGWLDMLFDFRKLSQEEQ